ncbi:MAG: FHA domain-containing protein, partial [bacterium]|nr:FHA domain-containing protein [bacterium]
MTPLTLDPITADGATPITLEPRDRPFVVGRSSQCDVVLPDPAGVVSRRHCEIRAGRHRWELRDLGSRHGTLINGVALVKDEWTALETGAALKIGASVFRVRSGAGAFATMVRTMDDRGSGSVNIRKVETQSETPDSARRLELLMRASASIGSAGSGEEIAELAVATLIDGTPYARVSVLRRANAQGTDLEVMASRSCPGMTPPSGFSRSLIESAAEGQTVLLSGRDAGNFGASIVSLGIGSAMCAPIMIDGVVDAYLYADTRAELGASVTTEVASLCQTLATMCGLAFADRYRRSLDAERKRRDAELFAAREVQAIIMPPETGGIAGLSYAMRCVPGRFVAGDMFDFVRIDDHRAAIYLGDVVGKGI